MWIEQCTCDSVRPLKRSVLCLLAHQHECMASATAHASHAHEVCLCHSSANAPATNGGISGQSPLQRAGPGSGSTNSGSQSLTPMVSLAKSFDRDRQLRFNEMLGMPDEEVRAALCQLRTYTGSLAIHAVCMLLSQTLSKR